jgi:hypothetical protein
MGPTSYIYEAWGCPHLIDSPLKQIHMVLNEGRMFDSLIWRDHPHLDQDDTRFIQRHNGVDYE